MTTGKRIHNGIVPRSFNKYLPDDDDADNIYGSRTNWQQTSEPLLYTRQWLSVFHVQITCKRYQMKCYGEEDTK
eukprot:12636849-Ditylum_brightwellii.AAC.1